MSRLGPEDYQSNRHIRKIMRLARATKGDVFFDLGCGMGKLCVVAVTEFGVAKAVGIELHKGRATKAARYVRRLGLSDRIEIWNEDYMESELGEATIVYCGHNEAEEDVPHFEEVLGAGSRFVSLFLPFVGVMPDAVDYPFYLMTLPFKKTKDVYALDHHGALQEGHPGGALPGARQRPGVPLRQAHDGSAHERETRRLLIQSMAADGGGSHWARLAGGGLRHGLGKRLGETGQPPLGRLDVSFGELVPGGVPL